MSLTMGITWYYQNQRGITSKSDKIFQGKLLLPHNICGNIVKSSTHSLEATKI